MESNHTLQQPTLSDRELEILKLVATGLTNQQIALQLFISVNTVKVHLRNIFSKLAVESRTEATMYAVREGWIELEGVPTAAEEEQFPWPQERISRWQRVFLLASALLIALVVFLPPARTGLTGTGNQFTDQANTSIGNGQDVASSRWVTKAQMPTSRARLAVVAYQGQIYAIGGETTEGVSGVVEVYDPSTDTWTRRASKPRPVRNIGAAVLGDRIYVPGGYDAMDQAIATVEVYDPRADAWSEVAPLPMPLFAYAIAAVNDKLYLFGGLDGIRYLDTVLVYDPDSDAWASGTPMSEPRGFSAATLVAELVYVLGGYDGQSESTLGEVYEPAKEGSGEQPWTRLAPMRVGRGGLAAVTVDNQVFAFGGGWTEYLSFNERYDVDQGAWMSFDSPVLSQWRTLGAAPILIGQETVIHVIGGWSDRPLSTNYAYRPSFRIFLPSL